MSALYQCVLIHKRKRPPESLLTAFLGVVEAATGLPSGGCQVQVPGSKWKPHASGYRPHTGG